MTADEVRTHIGYSGWASARLLDAVLKLDDEKRYRELSVPNRDIACTLRHVMWADAIWLSRLTDDAAVVPELSEDRPAHESMKAEWPELQRRWEAWAASLKDPDLTRVVAYKAMNGTPYETPVCQIAMHVVNHGTLHRGQVMAMLRQLGEAPPPTDLIFYYRELK